MILSSSRALSRIPDRCRDICPSDTLHYVPLHTIFTTEEWAISVRYSIQNPIHIQRDRVNCLPVDAWRDAKSTTPKDLAVSRSTAVDRRYHQSNIRWFCCITPTGLIHRRDNEWRTSRRLRVLRSNTSRYPWKKDKFPTISLSRCEFRKNPYYASQPRRAVSVQTPTSTQMWVDSTWHAVFACLLGSVWHCSLSDEFRWPFSMYPVELILIIRCGVWYQAARQTCTQTRVSSHSIVGG
jgi:hypothetical protein